MKSFKISKDLIFFFIGIIVYLYLITCCILFFNIIPIKSEVVIKKIEYIPLIISFLGFQIVYYIFFLPYYLKLKIIFNPKKDIINFLSATLLLFLLVGFVKWSVFTEKISLLAKLNNILVAFLFLSISVFYIIKFILNIFLFNFLFYKEESKVFGIYERGEFLRNANFLLSQARRHNLNLGLITIWMKNIKELERKLKLEEIKFLRKQLIFLLTHNSRLYEIWCRNEKKDVYFNFIQIKNKDELKFALQRFYNLLKKHSFTMYNKKIQAEFIFNGRFLNLKENEILEKNLNQFIDETIKAIKKQKKDFMIEEA